MLKRLAATPVVLAAMSAPAFAHLNPDEHGSFVAGLAHPLSGADHLLAMIAVGLWAAQIGGKARWIVPSAFVLTMSQGFVLALSGAPLPFVEPGILASVIGLGLLVALAVRVPTTACAAVVGVFALLHGHAHGGELGTATAVTFGLGFVAATTLLHAVGVASGILLGRRNPLVTRLIGAATAFGGAWLAFG